MPQFGRIPATQIAAVGAGHEADPAPWSVNGVLAQTVTFEIDIAAALDHLPDSLARPAPPYARIQVLDYPSSPAGPYREALLLVSCRYLMLPRQYIAASIVTSEAARDANARNWHYTSEVGKIDLQRNGHTFVSTISSGGGLEIRIESNEASGTSPAVIRYDPTVVVQPGEKGPDVLTISAEPRAVSEAWLAVGSRVSYSSGPRDAAWLRLRSLNPITCTVALQDVTLPEPQPVRMPAGGMGGLP